MRIHHGDGETENEHAARSVKAVKLWKETIIKKAEEDGREENYGTFRTIAAIHECLKYMRPINSEKRVEDD